MKVQEAWIRSSDVYKRQGYGYAVGNFRMEHEPDGIVFILPAKKAWNGAAARAACTFRSRDDLSDCACSGERTGGRDDPDGAVAALWNPGELLFPGGAGSTTGGAGSVSYTHLR